MADRSSAERMYRLLHDLYVLFDDSDRRTLRAFGLTNSQYTLLTLLDPHEGQHLTTLSDRLFCVRSTITRMIDHLEAAGLVQRMGDPHDRRAQCVLLTKAGVELRRRARQAHQRSLQSRLQILSEAEQQQLVALLEQVRDRVHTQLHESKEVQAE